MRFAARAPRTACAMSAVTLICGCASVGGDRLNFIAPGRVAIVPARFTPEPDFNTSFAESRSASIRKKTGEGALGAARGSAQVAGVILKIGSAAGPLVVFLVPPAVVFVAGVTTLGAVGGALAGATDGLPSGDASAVRQPIEVALRDPRVQEMVARRIAEINPDSYYKFSYLAGVGPASRTEAPDYRDLRHSGFESVLELAVVSVGFRGVETEPPSASLTMKLRARLVPLTPESNSWVQEWWHTSPPRPIPDWRDDDGSRLHADLEGSYRALTQYVSALLLAGE